MRSRHTPALTSGSLTIVRLCGLSHGADLRHVDEEEGEGAPGQALAHRPRRRRSRQHPQVRRGGRWRRGPGREALMAVRPSPPGPRRYGNVSLRSKRSLRVATKTSCVVCN